MFIFKVNVQSVHLETKCSQVKVSQGKNVTVDVSSGSKCHSGRNVGGRNVMAPLSLVNNHNTTVLKKIFYVLQWIFGLYKILQWCWAKHNIFSMKWWGGS
jgi:hypothetical protein